MPLMTRMHKVKFQPFVNELRRTSVGPDIAAQFGLPTSQEGFRWGEATDENLTFAANLKGYPTRKGNSGPRTQRGSGTWLLSQASVESQRSAPLELLRKIDNADLKSWRIDKPDGQLWLFQGWAYVTDDQQGLDAEDVRALINVEANKRRLTLEKAHALQAISDNYDRPKRREPIPQAVRVEVWQRDGGRCVECTSQEKLEFDHIIPVAMGGGNTSRNLQLLCETCNRRKGASLG
jgi:hypothetical protein